VIAGIGRRTILTAIDAITFLCFQRFSTLTPYQTLNEEKTVIDGVVIIDPRIFEEKI
jgi:hypothetical protein